MDEFKTKTILAAFRRGEFGTIEAARRLHALARNPARARNLLRAEYQKSREGRFLEELGNSLAQDGKSLDAEMAFQSALLRHGHLHVTNLNYIGFPGTRALVDDDRGILYIAIPKNSSSSILNMFSTALGGERHGEWVHQKFAAPTCIVTAEDLTTRYAGYFKFAVVRDPIDRIASYFFRNVRGGALKRAGFNNDTLMGLPTTPSLAKFEAEFEKYRQGFLDARHHTDAQTCYLGPLIGHDPELQIFGMGGVDTIREKLQELYGTNLSEERAMTSNRSSEEIEIARTSLTRLGALYTDDYEVFADVLSKAEDPEPTVFDRPLKPQGAGDWLVAAGTRPRVQPRLPTVKTRLRRLGRRLLR